MSESYTGKKEGIITKTQLNSTCISDVMLNHSFLNEVTIFVEHVQQNLSSHHSTDSNTIGSRSGPQDLSFSQTSSLTWNNKYENENQVTNEYVHTQTENSSYLGAPISWQTWSHSQLCTTPK